MAVPKRKTSKAKTSSRKAANMKMSTPGLSICPQCHEPKLPHRVCPNCGYYDGKDVVNAEQSECNVTPGDPRNRVIFFCLLKNLILNSLMICNVKTG